jgi:hypothetical protein
MLFVALIPIVISAVLFIVALFKIYHPIYKNIDHAIGCIVFGAAIGFMSILFPARSQWTEVKNFNVVRGEKFVVVEIENERKIYTNLMVVNGIDDVKTIYVLRTVNIWNSMAVENWYFEKDVNALIEEAE